MAEPSRDESAGEDPVRGENPEQEAAAQAEGQAEEAQREPAGESQREPAEEAQHEPAEEAPAAPSRGSKKGLLVGLGSGLVVGAVAGLAIAGLAKPDFLVGPGAPDDTASAVTAALASKNASGLAENSCRGTDGALAPQLPPQALQLIQSAKQSGPPRRSLDSEALTPVDLTLTAQGQTQTVPIDVVLGVTNGEWCMKGIADRQQ
ncbi:hypothetical protein F1721_10065 [Saccharopolyspora hirsuta]|uniref:Uncharacterized protein n=1 Tax=Saccharopolyspora hirsuta TaxID=1837 RepID=A0A5M7C124_SACHI|nr:hypothetical protein [Saccharopolyspora hirsuta]KAA5835130.1 hypothetical protein F1721_10065 [Saccharopolyspora hirsuta]